MAFRKKINPFSRTTIHTGFGVNANNYGGRFINKDGSFNLVKTGIPFWERFSPYQSLLSMPRWKFIGIIFLFFVLINLLFTLIYLTVGTGGLQGVKGSSWLDRFQEVYFFSTETYTTVGYGRINPVGLADNMVAAVESLSGFLSLAIATGLIYGRFARPRSYLKFSEQALVSPYKGNRALMFRLASYKQNHHLTQAEARINLGFTIMENNNPVFRFYSAELELAHIDTLSMNWTIVHPIDEKSPLWGFSEEDFRSSEVEVYVMIRGFDDVFSSTVIQRTSYTYQEIVFGAKFRQMYQESEDKNTTILQLDRLSAYDPVDLPVLPLPVS